MLDIRIPASIESLIEKRCKKNHLLLSRTGKALDLLSANPFYPSLKSHKILAKKTKAPAMSSWIDGEYRIVWEMSENNIISIIDFGTHKEVYL